MSAEGNVFGTYTGVLNHESLGKSQLVKLELIPERESNGAMKLHGILTLQFGGFDSSEYISYPNHDIIFNLMNHTLTFIQTNQEVYIRDATIKNNILRGELFSTHGRVGEISLSKDNTIKINTPLIEPLTGEYRGTCGNEATNLQLFSYRATSESNQLGNPFGAYEVIGQLGKRDPELCVGETKRFCTHSKIKSAFYNFFKGQLVLNGHPFNYSCDIEGNQIHCGNCQLKRISHEMDHPRLQLSTGSESPLHDFKIKKDDDNVTIAGTYNGYLYHNNLKKYQKVQMDLSTYQQPTTSGTQLMLSAVARLYFGNSQVEVLSYPFTPVEYPNPLRKPKFILSRNDSSIDAFLFITDFHNGIIKGDWYSLIFGKVGSFVVSKNGTLPELKNPPFLDQISFIYEESNKVDDAILTLGLITRAGQASLNNNNPFSPLNIGGWVWRKNSVNPKETIVQSSYDFYTGNFAILYGQDRVIGGQINLIKTPMLRRMGGGFGTYMQSFDLVSFEKMQKE